MLQKSLRWCPVPPSEPPVRITWHPVPPTPAQLAAWNWLWPRLLGHVDLAPKKEQPQDRDPGAITVATVTSGRHHTMEHTHDTTADPENK